MAIVTLRISEMSQSFKFILVEAGNDDSSLKEIRTNTPTHPMRSHMNKGTDKGKKYHPLYPPQRFTLKH